MPRDYKRVLQAIAEAETAPAKTSTRRSWRPRMADPQGFLKHTQRETPQRRPVPLRLRDWKEVYEDFSHDALREQADALHGLRYPVLPQRLSARAI